MSQAQANTEGIKISVAGVDVRYAADYQLIFNSEWPSTQIGFDTTVTVPSSQSVTVDHNLNFHPFTMGWMIADGLSVGRIGPETQVLMDIGVNTIYLANNSLRDFDVNLKCYNIDLTNPADYTLPQFPVIPYKYNPDFGIKVVKYGKSISSSDLRDFILNSQAQSPAILSIITEKGSMTSPIDPALQVISYTNPANYVPWIYGFFGHTNSGLENLVYTRADYAIQSPLGLTIGQQGTNGLTTTLAFDPDFGGATLVVIRDPLLVANRVEIQYG